VIRSKWIDIESTTPCVAGIDREFFWFAMALDIGEDGFNTVLMKLT
jgi:hypothetical protein